MKTSTQSDILRYIQNHQEVTAKEMANSFGISPQALFRHLKKLLQDGKVAKVGSPPRVFYMPAPESAPTADLYEVSPPALKLIEQNFLFIRPSGERLEGLSGFSQWCHTQRLPFVKTAEEYAQTLQTYDTMKVNGLISGIPKLRTTFIERFLDELYYLDFYSMEKFGKTKLGALLMYGKQGQNRTLIKEVYELIQERVHKLIKEKKVDAVGFIPPTVHRNLQFQKELERLLHLDLPHLTFVKAGGIAVPQKILASLDERVENARKTIFVQPARSYDTILLIDDAVGSGATLNETARKLKDRGFADKVIGLAVTGSLKGFEVLNEV